MSASTSRPGFTLIELVVAVMVLAVVTLGLGGATLRLIGVGAESAIEMAAVGLAEDRIAWILADPGYDTLEARYSDLEFDLAPVPGSTRETRVTRVRDVQQSGRILDYHTVTVTVTAPALSRPVSRTITIASP